MIREDWPFSLSVNGDPSCGSPATLVVNFMFSRESSAESSILLEQTIRWFTSLAELGALGGDSINPIHSHAVIESMVQLHNDTLMVVFSSLRIAPSSITILCNLLYSQFGSLVNRVTLESGGITHQIKLTPGSYPGIFHQIPFLLDQNRVEGRALIEIVFFEDIPIELHSELEDLLAFWAIICAYGGFPDISSATSGTLVPETSPEIVLDEARLSLTEQGTIDESAFFVLCNALIRFSVSRASIEQVMIT